MALMRLTKWLLVGLAAIAAVILLAVVVGLLIPREHVATSSIELRHPVDSVWAAVRDLGGVPAWWRDLKAAERVAGAPRETWRYTDRFDSPMPLEVIDEQPPTALVTRIVDAGGPFGGTWTYQVSSAEGGSRVTVTENGWISNPVFRVMARLVFGYHATLDSYLHALGERFGDSVEPVHVES